jgi:acetolactate synthase-1/2/3 large subunit
MGTESPAAQVADHDGNLVATALAELGVRFVFTLCGGHISPLLLGAKGVGIRVIEVRHEATAVYAADAVARLTGVPGVACVTAGPGLTNTITAVKNAQMAQSPVIVIGGASATLLQGRGSLQDIDQVALMRPHVKWLKALKRVRDLVPAVERGG